MITDGSPPNNRRGVGQSPNQLIDGSRVDSVIEFGAQSAVPALDQVDDVHHENKRDRDIDVAVVARVDEAAVTTVCLVQVQLAPRKCNETAGHEQAEGEALPVTLSTERPTERQSYWLLLHRIHAERTVLHTPIQYNK